MTMDEVVSTYSPSVLMIDIEGAELAFLEGATLTGINKVYVELHEGRIGSRGIKRIFDLLSKQNFAYDPAHSVRDVVLFRRLKEGEKGRRGWLARTMTRVRRKLS